MRAMSLFERNLLIYKTFSYRLHFFHRIWIVLIIVMVLAGGFPIGTSGAMPVKSMRDVTLYPPVGSSDLNKSDGLPMLYNFVRAVENGNGQTLVGVYVPGVMAFPVAQQPSNQPGFVLNQPGYVTQFSLASQYGTVGLLAHNNLAGGSFFLLQQTQEVILVFGDGSLNYYQLTDIEYFQALSPNSPYSDFIEINHPNHRLSVEQLFGQIYEPGERLVLQTCIEANGQASWGRLFVIGSPVDKSPRRSFQYKIERSWLN